MTWDATRPLTRIRSQDRASLCLPKALLLAKRPVVTSCWMPERSRPNVLRRELPMRLQPQGQVAAEAVAAESLAQLVLVVLRLRAPVPPVVRAPRVLNRVLQVRAAMAHQVL